MKKDKRIQQILHEIVRFSNGDYSTHMNVSENVDEIDAISAGLHALGEALYSRDRGIKEKEERMNALLDILLRYTTMDFSVKAPIGSSGDEIDALSAGLNALGEELVYHTTRLKDSEEQIKTIFNNAPDAVVVIDSKGIIVRWNPVAERIFGWTEAEVIGKFFHKILIPDRYREKHVAGMKHFLKTGEGPVLNKTIELPALRKNHSEIEIELIISPARLKDEYIFISFLRDITDRKKAEEQIRQRTEELQLANKELEFFSYSVSHDLRAPLRAIHGYSQMLEEDYETKLDEEGKRLISNVQSNAKNMGQLVDDLLEFSRLGKRELNIMNVDLNRIVEGVLKELNQAGNVRAKIKVHSLGRAKADSTLLKYVFQNLIDNAVKYSSKKENPEVEIGWTEIKGVKTYFVKDNGSGFDMAYYNKLFGVFQRLQGEEEFEGNGVGLAIVHRIISRHSGKIWAEGKVNEGATFYFTLDNSLLNENI